MVFFVKELLKKQTISAVDFLQPPLPVCSRYLYALFHTLFSKNHLNPQVSIKKMVNKHTRAYYRNLGQHLILARKGTFFEKKYAKYFTPLFNPFLKYFISKQSFP